MKKKDLKKYQHIIPRCYLKNFLTKEIPEAHLNNPKYIPPLYIKKPNSDWETESIGKKSIFTKKFYYDLDFQGIKDEEQYLENFFKKLEKLKTKKLKTKKLKEKNPQENKKISKEVDKSEKDIKKRQEEIRELLKVLLGRIPLFMYLTHALEEDLLEVLNNTQSEKMGLFRKATGIEVEDFEFLMDCGLIKSESIDSYIQRFKDIELLNYKTDNELM